MSVHKPPQTGLITLCTGLAGLFTLNACGADVPYSILEKETQLCEAQLSAVIDPDVYSGLSEQGLRGRAMVLAARLQMEPSRREPIGENIRFIVTKWSCTAYDRAGNPLGKYSTALSTDTLYWWVRTDDEGEIGLTKMVQKFDKKRTPSEAKSSFRLSLEPGKNDIVETRRQSTEMGTDEEATRTFAAFEIGAEPQDLKLTTRSRILEFGDDESLNRSAYCYELGGPDCEDPKTWDYHNFKYDQSGHIIKESGISEGQKYHYKRDFELNENGDIIREGRMQLGDESGEWTWGEYRRILYYDTREISQSMKGNTPIF